MYAGVSGELRVGWTSNGYGAKNGKDQRKSVGASATKSAEHLSYRQQRGPSTRAFALAQDDRAVLKFPEHSRLHRLCASLFPKIEHGNACEQNSHANQRIARIAHDRVNYDQRTS